MPAPPSNKVLPRHIEPRKLVLQGAGMSGRVPAVLLSRLAAAVVAIVDDASAELHFSRDVQGRYRVAGRVTVAVTLECQRCLEAIATDLSASCSLVIVWSEDQARQVPDDVDAWVVPGDSADVAELLEDELLLALPIVSLHPAGQCRRPEVPAESWANIEKQETGQVEGSPFSVLKHLKKPG